MPMCLLEPDDVDWVRWVSANPAANVFHHPAWTQLLSACYGYRTSVLAVRDQSGQIQAGIPIMEVTGFAKGRRWVALPFSDHCSPLFTSAGALDELQQGLFSQFQRGLWPRLEVRWNLPSLSSASVSSHHVFHQIDLDDDPSRVRNRFQSMHRRNIKTAENSGLRIQQGYTEQYLREFYRLHLITRRRQGMPTQPWRFFQLLGRLLLAQDLGFIVLAYKGEECVAASVFLKWQKTLMYKYGASNPNATQYRPNNLVMWTAIRWGCENGYAVFDMGRTDTENTGLRQYKSGWGAQETPLAYTVLSQKPEQNGSGRMKHLMQVVIRNSPVWVSQVTGQLLYRYLG